LLGSLKQKQWQSQALCLIFLTERGQIEMLLRPLSLPSLLDYLLIEIIVMIPLASDLLSSV
jgi:hypothetical protein